MAKDKTEKQTAAMKAEERLKGVKTVKVNRVDDIEQEEAPKVKKRYPWLQDGIHPAARPVMTPDGVFPSLQKAAKRHGIVVATMWYRLNVAMPHYAYL